MVQCTQYSDFASEPIWHKEKLERPGFIAQIAKVYLGPDNPKAIQYTRAIATLYMVTGDGNVKMQMHFRLAISKKKPSSRLEIQCVCVVVEYEMKQEALRGVSGSFTLILR